MSPRLANQTGVALVVVMWLLVLLAAVVGLFAVNARSEAQQASALRQRAQLEAAAEAGIEATAARLLALDARRRPVPDGRETAFDFGDGVVVTVAVHDESGKLDLNAVDATLLERLLTGAGVERERSAALAAAIIDWRDADGLVSPNGGAEAREYHAAGLPYGPANRPFGLVSELQRVLGMDHALYRRLKPWLTVYTGLPQPNLAFAPAEVMATMGLSPVVVEQVLAARAALDPAAPAQVLPGGIVLAASGTGAYSISSRAQRADGPAAELEATVRVGAGGFLGQVYTPLVWRHGQQD